MILRGQSKANSASDEASESELANKQPRIERAHTYHFPLSCDASFDKEAGDLDSLNRPSLVSNMIYSLASDRDAPSLRRAHTLPASLTKKLLSQSTLIDYHGVSRPLWETRFDATCVDKSGKNVFCGSFDTPHAAARAVDVMSLRFGYEDEELNFDAQDYDNSDRQLIASIPIDELVMTLIAVSENTERRASRFRGVYPTELGFESRLELGP